MLTRAKQSQGVKRLSIVSLSIGLTLLCHESVSTSADQLRSHLIASTAARISLTFLLQGATGTDIDTTQAERAKHQTSTKGMLQMKFAAITEAGRDKRFRRLPLQHR